MSQFAEVYGNLYFKTKEGADKARAELLKNGYFVEDSKAPEATESYYWDNDGGYDEDAKTPRIGKAIYFNGGSMRNIGQMLDSLLEDFKDDIDPLSSIRCVCFDGCFSMSEWDGTEMQALNDDKLSKIMSCDFASVKEIMYYDESYMDYEVKADDWVMGA